MSKLIKNIFICSESDELKYLLTNLSEKGCKWKNKYDALEYDMFNVLFFDKDFLTTHEDKAVRIVVYADNSLEFCVIQANNILFYKPDNYSGSRVYPERIRIKTISGSMPYVEYLNMLAEQYGYKTYKKLRLDGLKIAI